MRIPSIVFWSTEWCQNFSFYSPVVRHGRTGSSVAMSCHEPRPGIQNCRLNSCKISAWLPWRERGGKRETAPLLFIIYVPTSNRFDDNLLLTRKSWTFATSSSNCVYRVHATFLVVLRLTVGLVFDCSFENDFHYRPVPSRGQNLPAVIKLFNYTWIVLRMGNKRDLRRDFILRTLLLPVPSIEIIDWSRPRGVKYNFSLHFSC